ncbi:MAG: hypothetical protein JWQ71_1539 [Pedosphaera sp.]|nr:hypothetical protein [Pedosphaera sp.]
MKALTIIDRLICLSAVAITSLTPFTSTASENIPQKPFGQFTWLPTPNQWIVTPWYQYTDIQDIWRGTRHENVSVGDKHGFDQNDGLALIEYGIKKDWAADLQLGYTSLATRSFSTPPGTVRSTSGLMDVTFGLRWQVLNENDCDCGWRPTVTLRAGGIYRGTYDHDFPLAPGNGSVGIEPSVLITKSFGWQGFGMYGNLGYRNLRSGGNDQVFGSVGFNQAYKGFTFSAGYRHQQNTAGSDIGGVGNTIIYSSNVKEINQLADVGVGYTDRRHHHYQFYLEKSISGRNTGDKETYGIYASFPIGGK